MSYRNNLKVFQDSVVKQAFTELYYRYVLVHVDKTTSNTVIICWRLYALTLITKFVLDRDTRNYTTNYHETCSHFQEDWLVAKHSKGLCYSFCLFVNNGNKHLPLIYWWLKLHKKPTKARLIILALLSSTKPLSKSLTSVFKLFFRQIDSYISQSRFFSFIDSFYTLLNNTPVIYSTNGLNAANLHQYHVLIFLKSFHSNVN